MASIERHSNPIEGVPVEEFGRIWNLGRSKAFEVVHSEGFPKIRIGRRIIIPLEKARVWMEQQAEQQEV